MKRILSIGLTAAFLLLGTCTSWAEPILFFSTTAPDLDNLAVGQTISFDVNLSGVNSPTDNLDFLAATVTFNSDLLGTPTISPGGIVPDLTGFLSTAHPGLADANYDTLFATTGAPISTSGPFFSFEVTVQSPGSGQVAFDFIAAMRGNDDVPIQAGPSLLFSAHAIPEPSSWLMLCLGLLPLAMLLRASRRSAA